MASVGLILPQRAVLFGATSYVELCDLAVDAEQSGRFDTLWVGDSLTSKPRAEALAFLGVLAGRTESIRLGVGCLASFPLRDPALLAFQWASLDQLSAGRMLLSVCNGLQKRDSASANEGAQFGGVPDRDRAARVEEFIPLVRQFWTGQPVDFDGRFVSYHQTQILPVPVQNPCPVWLTANPPTGPLSDRILGRAARLADGYVTTRSGPRSLADVRTRLDDAVVSHGRDAGAFPLGVYHSINVGPDREACLDETQHFFDSYYGEGFFSREAAASITTVGPPECCIEDLLDLRQQGVTHIGLRLSSWRQREQFDLVVNEVLPQLEAELARDPQLTAPAASS